MYPGKTTELQKHAAWYYATVHSTNTYMNGRVTTTLRSGFETNLQFSLISGLCA